MTTKFKRASVYFVYMFIILLSSQNVYSNELVYTIQTGSFAIENDAGTQFDLIVKELHGKELDHLRIEKIGKYYSLRIGKYHDRALADKLFAKVKKKFSSALVMNAYVKEERIIRSYSDLSEDDWHQAGEEPSVDDTLHAELIYSIQTGSFSSEEAALKQFDFIMRKLQGSDLDLLRIEKIGEYYCVRIGNFNNRESADSTYKAIRAILPKAVIVDAYMKKQRIVKLHRGVSIPEVKKTPDTNRHIQESDDERVPETIVKQDQFVPGISGPSKNKDGHDAGRADAKSTINEDTVPELFLSDKKTHINENLQRKIRPNSERQGDMYVEKKQYFQALEEYRRARYKRPILRRKIAMLLYKTGFVDDAISEMETLVELSPAISADRMMLGSLYLAKDKDANAKEQFIKALEINPGDTYAYVYLAELFLREKEYGMAWLSVKMAQKLGYKGEGLVGRLRSVSSEPSVTPWSIIEEGLSLRLILVNSNEQAGKIIGRINEGELFEKIAGEESAGTGRNAGGYIGLLSPSEVDSEIFAAIQRQDAFAKPVIVKTDKGYHIVQRVVSFNMNEWKKILAGNEHTDLLTSNGAK